MAKASNKNSRVAKDKRAQSSEPPSDYDDPSTFPDEFAILLDDDHLAPQYPKGSYLVIDKRLPCNKGDLVVIYPTPAIATRGADPIVTHLRTVISPGITLPVRMAPGSECQFVLYTSHVKDDPMCTVLDVHKMQAMYRVTRKADLDELST